MIVGRLAPTPSGRLHLGNVCAAGAAWLSVRQAGGRLRLRIEDIDIGRARGDVADAIRVDLAWLGLTCDDETPPQSQRDYAPALARLAPHTYRCGCTRAASRDAGGACVGGCRTRGLGEGAVRFALPHGVETIVDRARGRTDVDLATLPDPVLRRRDGCCTYTLAVVADDIADGVTEVARGADLAEQSALQAVLWRALGADPPAWLHAPLISGRRWKEAIEVAPRRGGRQSARARLVGRRRVAGRAALARRDAAGVDDRRGRHAARRAPCVRRRADAPRAIHLDP